MNAYLRYVGVGVGGGYGGSSQNTVLRPWRKQENVWAFTKVRSISQ